MINKKALKLIRDIANIKRQNTIFQEEPKKIRIISIIMLISKNGLKLNNYRLIERKFIPIRHRIDYIRYTSTVAHISHRYCEIPYRLTTSMNRKK